MCLGNGCSVQQTNETAICRYNTLASTADTLLSIGNGTSDVARSNVVTIKDTGNMAIR